MSDDPYVYPGTTVLRNALGIRDANELHRVEANLTRLRLARLAANPVPGEYDLAHLQMIHGQLFDGLYAWAGELRTVPIAKSDLFCLPQHITSYARNVFGELAHDRYLVGLARDAFVERLAHHLGNVNALHPFREGNGRVTRAFFGRLAADAGYQLRWEYADPDRNITASIAAMRGDEQPLRELLSDVVRAAHE